MRGKTATTLVVLALASLLAVLAAGCGGGSDEPAADEAQPAATAAAQTQAGEAAETAAPAALEGSIDVWIMDPGAPEVQEVIKGYATDFEAANPGATVNLQFVPWPQAHDQFTTAIAGGEVPDVAEMGTTWTPEFGALGAFEPVPAAAGDDYVSSLVEAGTVDGQALGRPWYAGARAFIYRKDIFDELGLQAPQTWDDVLAAAETIKAEKPDMFPIGITGLTEHYYLPLVWQAGGEIAEQSGDTWTSDLGSPEAVAALQYYQELYEKGYVPKAAVNWEEPDNRQAFINGEIAMMYGGGWDYDQIVQDNPDIEVGVVLAPAGPGDNRDAFAGGSHLVVFDGSENKDLANAFVDFMLQPENVTDFTSKIGFLPGTVSGIEASGYLEDPVKAPFAEQLLDDSNVYPPSPKWGTLEGANIFDQVIQTMLKGDETPQEAGQELATAMDEQFAS